MKPSSLSIANFKAFGFPPQELPLKPITLVFGQNSAGKSSAIHSLLWFNHLIRTGSANVRFPALAEGKVDLGGFHQTLHRHESERRIIFGIQFPKDALSSRVAKFFRVEETVSLDLSFGQTSANSIVQLMDYRLKIDGFPFLIAIRKGEEDFVVSSLDILHDALAERIAQMSVSIPDEPPAKIMSMAEIEKLSADERADLLAEKVREHEQNKEEAASMAASGLVLDFEGILPKAVRSSNADTGDDFWDVMLPARVSDLVTDLHRLATESIDGLRYVPPLRDLPPRYFDLGEADSIWQKLFEERSLLHKVNEWLASEELQTKYELVVAEYFSRGSLEREIPSLIQESLAKAALSTPDGEDSFSEELQYVIAELQEKYGEADIEQFLRSQLDLFRIVLDRDVEYVIDDDTFPVPHPSGKSPQELSYDEVREHVEPHLNWEAWVGVDALKSGDYDAVELFQRWASKQPLLLELFDRHGDPSVAAFRFLGGNQFGSREIRREILLRHKNNKTEVSLQDVGIGISQVLPVLLHAYGSKERLIAIEQPEIHIHPALQAELGDVFIESALGENKNAFLIETHSEHLILRILRRIRETTESDRGDWSDALKKACPQGICPEDVAVFYVQPGEDGARVIELPVNAQGEFNCDWPGGFFEERIKELGI